MNPAQPWQVSYPDVVRQALGQLHRRARERGLGRQVIEAAIQIDDDLHNRPDTFGEEVFRLRHLHLQVRVAFHRPLLVRFAVHEQLPLVFVRAIEALSHTNLE
jgi:hypothetical protein